MKKLEAELERLVDRRSLCETKAERIKLIPEAVRITGAIAKVERAMRNSNITSQRNQRPKKN
jgi:hypothetical protein